jgi:hypothetical protein
VVVKCWRSGTFPEASEPVNLRHLHCLPGGLPQDLGQVLHHLPGILVEQGVVLHNPEAVVVLLQDGHELVDGKSAAHFQFREVAVQPAGAAAADGCLAGREWTE